MSATQRIGYDSVISAGWDLPLCASPRLSLTTLSLVVGALGKELAQAKRHGMESGWRLAVSAAREVIAIAPAMHRRALCRILRVALLPAPSDGGAQ